MTGELLCLNFAYLTYLSSTGLGARFVTFLRIKLCAVNTILCDKASL